MVALTGLAKYSASVSPCESPYPQDRWHSIQWVAHAWDTEMCLLF